MKKFAALFVCVFVIHGLFSQNNYRLLIGTYTSSGKSEGIYVYNFNTDSGTFSFTSKATGITNPSYLAVSSDAKKVYAVSEAGKGKGAINAFDFDVAGGQLKFLNSVSSGGDGPCYVEVDAASKTVFCANYGGGSLSAINLNADGTLGSDIQTIKYEGHSVHKDQGRPHVHTTVLSPDQRYLVATDLGTDKIHVYPYRAGQMPLDLEHEAITTIAAGSGPRHVTFDAAGRYLYVVNELNGTVTALDFNKGSLKEKQTVSMLKPGFNGTIEAADIHISPDNKFLYASNREESNEVVIWKIKSNGSLKYCGRQPVLGKAPRNFAIDPTGKYLLVANQNTDEIVVFKRNFKTGLLSDTGTRLAIGMPVCLKFVKY